VEAAAATDLTAARELAGDKAARIVEAMRVSVAARGIAGATFDHVAREAGVSRGLLHYYFATKERLLVEVVRRESDVRIEALEAAVGGAEDAEGVLAALVRSFEELIGEGQTAVVMFYEMMTLAQRNPEIATELWRCAPSPTLACCASATTPRSWPRSCSPSRTGSRSVS
jgi:AcrR family transcriptional regulator